MDKVVYGGSDAGVTVNLASGIGLGGDAEGDNYAGIENIDGSAFNDTLTGNLLDNQIYGEEGNDTISGRRGDDILVGQDGNDVLNGGKGADLMIGGRGDDAYKVDDLGDRIIEHAGFGTDRVVSSVSYVLGNYLERLKLREDAGAIDGSGNGLDNRIMGNSSANSLSGDAGDDLLNGFDGNDILNGGLGSDVLIGGAVPILSCWILVAVMTA